MTLTQGIYFWWYRYLSDHLYPQGSPNSTQDFFLLTLLAGVICAVLSNPLWLISTRAQLNSSQASLAQVMLDIYRQEGVSAFFKGVIPNLVLVINPIINYVMYESLKQRIEMTSTTLFLASCLSKSCATFVTYPILTIRVRLQAGKRGVGALMEGGLLGLYSGLGHKFLHTVLYNACMMVIYENIRSETRVIVTRLLSSAGDSTKTLSDL